jgi:nucleotide-binding universal stress UspA family protein
MINDIALIVDGKSNRAGPYATSLASMLDAHLTAIAAAVEPQRASYASAELRYDLIASATEELRERATEASTKLAADGNANGVRMSSLALDCFEGADFDTFKEMLRIFDLVIVEQADRGAHEGRTRVIEALVLASGPPVLVVPYIHSGLASLKNILVAWDGSAPAARALSDALPLLVRAAQVEILNVDGKGLADIHEHGRVVTRHLARHGIDATFKQTTSAGDIGNTILSHAADIGANFLVMGAYGHSKLREALFGGTTRTLLESMTIPVLMSR